MRRGKVYYAKLARGKAMFLAPRMIPYFHAIWGVRRSEEKRRLSRNARAILRVLREEWEMSTADLRDESGVEGSHGAFTKAIDELQAAMLVVPSEVVLPAEVHLHLDARRRTISRRAARRVEREAALREIARCFLAGAGMTIPGELARVTGLSRPEAGLGNRALVDCAACPPPPPPGGSRPQGPYRPSSWAPNRALWRARPDRDWRASGSGLGLGSGPATSDSDPHS